MRLPAAVAAALDYTAPVAVGVGLWVWAVSPIGERLVAVLRGSEPVGREPLDVPDAGLF